MGLGDRLSGVLGGGGPPTAAVVARLPPTLASLGPQPGGAVVRVLDGLDRVPALPEGVDECPPSLVEAIDDVCRDFTEDHRFFRPSMVFGCKRQSVFHHRRASADNSKQNPKMLRILANGTAVHEVVQNYLGRHPGYWFAPESKVAVEVEGKLIRGSCDGVMIRRSDLYRFGVEIKSINDAGFRLLKSPKDAHVAQASLYARLHGLPWIVLLYWNKNSQDLKEFPVRYDPQRWEDTKARIRELGGYVDRGELPEYDVNTCSTEFCGYLRVCRKNGAPV